MDIFGKRNSVNNSVEHKCDYETIMEVRNVTVRVIRCKECGHVTAEIVEQENTEKIDNKKENK